MEIVADTKRLESGSKEILKNGVCAGIAATAVMAASPIVTGFVAVGALGSIVAHEAAKNIFQSFPGRFSSSFVRACTLVAAIALTLFSAIYVSSFFVVPAALHTLTVLSVGALYTGMQGALFCIATLAKKVFKNKETDVREPFAEEVKSASPFGVGNSFKSVISWCKAHPKTIIFTLYSIKGTLTLFGSLYFGSKLFSSATTPSSPPNVGNNNVGGNNVGNNKVGGSSPSDSSTGNLLESQSQNKAVISANSALSAHFLNISEQSIVATHDQGSSPWDSSIGNLLENRTQNTAVISANSASLSLSSPHISEQSNTLFTVATVAIVGATIIGVISYRYLVSQKREKAKENLQLIFSAPTQPTSTALAVVGPLKKNEGEENKSSEYTACLNLLEKLEETWKNTTYLSQLINTFKNQLTSAMENRRVWIQDFSISFLRENKSLSQKIKNEDLITLIKVLSRRTPKIPEENRQDVDQVKQEVVHKLNISQEEKHFLDSKFLIEEGARCRFLLAQEALFQALLEGEEHQNLLNKALFEAKAYFQAVLQCRLIDTDDKGDIERVLDAAAVLLCLQDLEAPANRGESIVIQTRKNKKNQRENSDLNTISWVFKKVLHRKDRPEIGTTPLKSGSQFYWGINEESEFRFCVDKQQKIKVSKEIAKLIQESLKKYSKTSALHACLTLLLPKEELSYEEGFTFCEDLLCAMLTSKEGEEAVLAQQMLSLFFAPFSQGDSKAYNAVERGVGPVPFEAELQGTQLFREIRVKKGDAKLADFLRRARATLRHQMYTEISIYGVKSQASRSFNFSDLLEKAFEVQFMNYLKGLVQTSKLDELLGDLNRVLDNLIKPMIGLEEDQKTSIKASIQDLWEKSAKSLPSGKF